jgi:hypothetical protein
MKPAVRTALVSAALWLAAAPVRADVVFPARFDMTETEPGRYDISFTLPVMEGRVLRAEPTLPPTCRDLTERERAGSYGGVTTSWTVRCEPASLAGEAILVEGLLGTQIELAFNLTTLDGRVFSEILKPSRPGFLVPPPPSVADLAADAGGAGLRWVLGQGALWLLLLVAGLAGATVRELARGTLAFSVAAAAGQWLVGEAWLGVSPPVAGSLVLLTAAVPAIRLAGGSELWRGWIRPLWPVMLPIGALTAGTGGAELPVAGLSRGEQLAALAFFAVGAAVAVAWIALVAVELWVLVARVDGGRWLDRGTRLLGYGLGAIATGMLLARVVALGVLADDFPPRALVLAVAAMAVAPLLVAARVRGRWIAAAFAVLAAVGLAPGLARAPVPLAELLVPALLLCVSLLLASGLRMSRRWAVVMAVPTVVVCSWWGTLALVDNVSRSTGASVATLLVAAMLFFIAVTICRQQQLEAGAPAARAVGLAVASWVVIGRLASYWTWFEREVATDAALGLLRVPLAALVLVGLAATLWPRRRRVLDELGVARRSRSWHWAALAAAFLAVSYGTVAVPNPFHEPQAPRGDDARRVASAVLFDTYRAFNLRDEEEVFDRLADSVTGDLVEDLYLDSRRRLNAGTRAGTEVTVRDVSVVEIGDPTEKVAGSGAFAYDCRWVVTSRVRHLQHIHHRQNIYGGVLTLTVDGGRWKIARVELASEDRVVMARQPT